MYRFNEATTPINLDDLRIDETALNRYIAHVFGWTFLGLFTTAATVMFFIFGSAASPAIAGFLAASLNMLLFIGIGQLALVFVFSMRIHKMRTATAKLMYLFYAVSMGFLFTWVALFYQLQTIGIAFLITSVSFGTMALYGLVTKADLTRFGSLLLFALIGLIIASVANWFLGNSTLDLIIILAGLFIFLALTVYDAQRIKHNYFASVDEHGDPTVLTQNLAIFSALGLYLNFINIFLFILRLLSRD